VAVVIILLAILLCCLTLHSEQFATGLIEEKLKKELRERQYLTPEEHEEILEQIENALRVDPNNFSANLLRFELDKKIIR